MVVDDAVSTKGKIDKVLEETGLGEQRAAKNSEANFLRFL